MDAETRSSLVKRLCLCLYISCTKLRHYLLSAECIVVCKDDVVKYMWSLPILNGRIEKWILPLSEFDLRFESAKSIKGQVMGEFITHHYGPNVSVVPPAPWTLFFDGSSCGQGCGMAVILISPREASFEFSLPIPTIYQLIIRQTMKLCSGG